MTDLEYIDYCMNTKLPPAEKEQFEKRVASDPLFAQEVAFFLSAIQLAKEKHTTERKKEFKELYAQKAVVKKISPVRKIWYAVAAAAVIAGLIFGYNLWFKPVSGRELAAQYVKENFTTLSITMGNEKDSMQSALNFYNKGELPKAAQQFDSLIESNSMNVDAKKYAGIVYLRMKDYDKAIARFQQLENMQGLYSNPGKFYEATTLMERNKPGDLEMAKQLLQLVITQNLGGSEKAKEWLKKL